MQSENELAARFSASRSTVIRALRAIEEDGLIERRQGSGSFVTQKAAEGTEKRVAYGLLRSVQSGRYSDTIVDQIQSKLSEMLQHRRSALIAHTVGGRTAPVSVAGELIQQQVGGVFMVPMQPPTVSPRENEQIAAAIIGSGQPVVLLDEDIAEFPYRSQYDLVTTENRVCGCLQTQHLLEAGARRLLFLGPDRFTPAVAERHLGYLDAFRAAGLGEPPAEWVCRVASNDLNEGFVEDLMKRHRPEGLVCKSDEFAALFMRHLTRLGVRVPEDLKIVGFDDRPIASLVSVPLTTIRQPVTQLAEAALQLMDTRLDQPDRPARRVLVSGELIVRQSTAANR